MHIKTSKNFTRVQRQKKEIVLKEVVLNNCITAEVLNHAARLRVHQSQRLYCARQPITANAHWEKKKKKEQKKSLQKLGICLFLKFVVVTEK